MCHKKYRVENGHSVIINYHKGPPYVSKIYQLRISTKVVIYGYWKRSFVSISGFSHKRLSLASNNDGIDQFQIFDPKVDSK